jgi:DNA-directed RNA polymerase specialized sigma24 family protein
VAGWPSIDRADDQWLAQALRSGDAAATARFYDLYATRLFDYCHVLLRDEEAAGLALLDALIIVGERIGEVTDPRLFRGRLYAVTREECLRRRSELPAERRRAAEAGGEADEATRRLIHAALLVLTGRQREALDLSLRHELAPEELAEVLRVTPQDASMLLVQACRDLDDAVAAVMVATTGREDCPSIPALAGPLGRRLDAETCGKLTRHIARCPICGARADHEVATARLLNAMPFAALPASLRQRFVAAAADPRFVDLRSTIVNRAQAAAEVEAVREEEPRGASRLWPVTAAVAVAVGVLAIGGGVLYVLPDSGSRNAGNNQAIGSRPADSPSGAPSTSNSGWPMPKDGAISPSATPSDSSGTPTPTPTLTPGGSQHPKSQSTSPSPPGAPPPPAPPTPGTLAVYGCTMRHTRNCTVTVVAQGGPVNWSVTGVSGGISAGGGGSLAAGQQAGVTVTRNASWCVGSGSGSVSFSSGAAAPVNWRC